MLEITIKLFSKVGIGRDTSFSISLCKKMAATLG